MGPIVNIAAAAWLLGGALASVGDPAVQVEGACPSQSAVMDALLPVLAKDALRRTSEVPRVIDLGDRYVVSAAGQSSPYRDAARDCAERARVSAVFIALALNPPIVAMAVPSAPQPPPSPPPVPARSEPSTEPPTEPPTEPSTEPSRPAVSWKQMAVSGRLDHAFATEGAPAAATGGGELRGALGWGTWGIAATGGALAPTTTRFHAIAVRERRFPFSLALVAKARLKPAVELSGHLGFALALLTLRAPDISENAPSSRVDVGARLGVEVAGPRMSDSFALFAGIHGEYFPRPYVMDVDQLPRIGVTHHFWAAASLGISFERP